MRQREVRAYIYAKNVKFKIPDRDWLWVGLLTGPQWLFFIVVDTLVFPMRLFGIFPEWVFTTPACFIGSILFFSYIHTGRVERWFAHRVQAFIEAPTHRAILPSDLAGKEKVWLIMPPGERLPAHPDDEARRAGPPPAFEALRA